MHGAAPASKFHSIEALRFLAATAVVFVHIPVIEVGHFGVDVFFVISGFVMMLSTEHGHEKFFVKRLIRIVPIYWLFTLGVFAIALLVPSLLKNTTSDVVQLAKSLLFIPFDKGNGHRPVLFLGWTLNYEMYFYALFALSLRVAPRQRALLTAAALAGVYLLCLGSTEYPAKAYGDPIVFEFVFGMALYLVLVKRQRAVPALLVAASLALAALWPDVLAHRVLRYGLPSVVFVGVVLALVGDRRLPPSLVMLGGASYALYLTHPYIIQFFDKVTHWFSRGPGYATAATVISLVAVNVVAVLVYRFFEVPVRRRLRERFAADGARRPPRGSSCGGPGRTPG